MPDTVVETISGMSECRVKRSTTYVDIFYVKMEKNMNHLSSV